MSRAALQRVLVSSVRRSSALLACGFALLCQPDRAGAVVDPAGGVGGGSLAGTLTVTVVDARNATAVSGAFVQVGPRVGVPFAGNIKTTSVSGTAVFTHAALTGLQTVTVGKAGYTYLTIFDVNAAQMVLPIALKDDDVPKALYSGSISGFTIQQNDGQLDVSIVMPTLDVGDLTSFANFGQFAPIVLDTFPLVGEQPITGNVYLPLQIEFLFIPLERTPYFIWLPDQTTQDVFSFYGRIPNSTLLDALGSPDPEFLPLIVDFEMRKVGMREGVVVNGPDTENITLSNNTTKNLKARVANTEDGTTVFAICAADLDSLSGLGRIAPCGFDGLEGGAASTVLTLDTITSGGAFTGMNYVCAGLASDTTFGLANSAVVDRSGLVVGDTAQITTFFTPPEPAVGGATFSWSTIDNPGVSPDPSIHFAQIDLVKTIPDTNPGAEPADTLDIPTAQWEFVMRGNDLNFSIPELGPGIPPGITNPDFTADQDRLDWTITGFGLTLPPAFDYNSWNWIDRATKATHLAWNSQRFISFPDTLYTSVPIAPQIVPDPFVSDARPNPFRSQTTVEIDLALAPGARLEVFDVSGRRLRVLWEGGVSTGTGTAPATWDGSDDFGRPVPPGNYFLRLDTGAHVFSRKVIKVP